LADELAHQWIGQVVDWTSGGLTPPAQAHTLTTMTEQHQLHSLCVYCGSGEGEHPEYRAAAKALGTLIGENGMRLVYGGGSIGLMGIVAQAAIDHGAEVTGIIPEFLVRKERMLEAVKDLRITRDMHERKRIMFEQSDAFIALPGGIGTLEEVIEMMTWSQLGQHNKPVLLANIAGFWDPLLVLLDHMKEQHFLRPGLMAHYLVVDSVEAILPALEADLAFVDQDRRAGLSLDKL
jgi:uncharacterized protein (TIGR00730 family)